jgi:hypothetical protein
MACHLGNRFAVEPGKRRHPRSVLTEGEWRPPNPKSATLARVARALDLPVEEMFARAGRDAAPSTRATSQETSAHDDVGPGAVERIRELEERVAHTEQEMAELRQLLERQRAGRADAR